MAVNLHAPNFLSKLFVESQQTHRQGREDDNNDNDEGGVILNVSSIHSQRSNEYMAAYAASKAALDSLTRTMAIEYAPYNIRANAVAPGVVPVERTAAAFADTTIQKSWTDRLPLQRTGTVQEVAHASLALMENDWVTGSVWQIDGGMMARANMPQRPRPSSLVPPSPISSSSRPATST